MTRSASSQAHRFWSRPSAPPRPWTPPADGSAANPYRSQPDYAFWSRSVAGQRMEQVDPVVAPAFRIGPTEQVATAGSCFAQHIAKTLVRKGYNYLVTEPGPEERQYGVYPARFANLYTVRQLRQLFERAYGLFLPQDSFWRWKDRFVDPFRPQIEAEGFASVEALLTDRERHLAAVRRMFETCNVFVFTLGLTEGWVSLDDGAVVPLAPGVHGLPEQPERYGFVNFGVKEMAEDLADFVEKLRLLNPSVKIVFTVSPVSLVATYENRHVLVSTISSKSALRVVAEMVANAYEGVAYFPSYEIITGHPAHYSYFEGDLRSVTPEGVDRVMTLFAQHYLSDTEQPWTRPTQKAGSSPEERAALYCVVCEEEALDR